MGGGNKKGGAPAAPDFSKLAMVNQANPYGSVSWGKDANGNLSMNTGFSGPMAGIFGNVQQGMNKASQMDPSQAGQQAFDKVYGAYESRLNPLWQQRQGNFDAAMANQGLTPGTQAYGNASRAFGEQRNDAYNQAIGQAVGLGQQEQAQSRANAMAPFAQAGMMQNWLPQGNANAPLVAGMRQYEASKDAASANNSKKGSALGGLGSIAGTVFGGPLGGALGGGLGSLLGGGGGSAPADQNWGYDYNLGGYNF